VLALLALAGACGGHSQSLAPQYTQSQLDCLVTLETECCPSGGSSATCIGDFVAARECSSWSEATTLAVFAAPCQGLTAVREIRPGTNYASFYIYDASGALFAIGDDAATPDPRSGAIECGAGPSGWVIPSACAALWLGSSGSAPCGAGTTGATSICPR
jgi:hypothetical protein